MKLSQSHLPRSQDNRMPTLDYLRGFMACSVMAYHFSYWTFGDLDSSTILGRIGLYGVSCFYILSGITLYLVYGNYPTSFISVLSFALKRIFRIYPLLWATTLIYVVSLKITDIRLLLLNFSGLFGFIEPSAGIATGVWSIGNELVFYSLFPVLLLASKKDNLFYGLLCLIFIVEFYFAFFSLNPQIALEKQWATYVNPFNQLFLFAGGVGIAYFSKKIALQVNLNVTLSAIVFLTIIFCFYPEKGDVIAIVTGINRIIYSFVCFLLCAFVLMSNIRVNSFFHKIFSFLGEASYSIYLLHPVVYYSVKVFSRNFIDIHAGILPISLIGTFIISHLSYRYFEKPIIRLGATLTKRFNLSVKAN